MEELIKCLQEQLKEKDKQIEHLQFLLKMKIGYFHYPPIMEPFFIYNKDKNKIQRIDQLRIANFLEGKGLEVKDGKFYIPVDGIIREVEYHYIKGIVEDTLRKQAASFMGGAFEDEIMDMFVRKPVISCAYLKSKFMLY